MLGVKRCQTRRIEVNKYLIGCMENGPPWENSNRQHLAARDDGGHIHFDIAHLVRTTVNHSRVEQVRLRSSRTYYPIL